MEFSCYIFSPENKTHKQLNHNILGAINQGCRGTILFSTQYIFVIIHSKFNASLKSQQYFEGLKYFNKELK